jgi:hypothetical protein
VADLLAAANLGEHGFQDCYDLKAPGMIAIMMINPVPFLVEKRPLVATVILKTFISPALKNVN